MFFENATRKEKFLENLIASGNPRRACKCNEGWKYWVVWITKSGGTSFYDRNKTLYSRHETLTDRSHKIQNPLGGGLTIFA